ncbi:hypothetical protein G4B88_000744 [Cannabis sativa]|uniref:F-box domain-containing protein n=1 Tax=Cannabis sativa TaxID=3483 RepID=A0A7J6I2R9_CANSA|nr:hypothetical protein G4B88_000744 [Cannabis sativa]
MASSSAATITMPCSPKKLHSPNWLKLPWDLTGSILFRLGAIEIMTSVQMVCKSWLDICKDPLMWKTIDMHNDGDPDTDLDLEQMCCDVVDRSYGQLLDINIEYFGCDELLPYITASLIWRQTEYMVDMKCEGCVNAVKNKFQIVNGVKSVEVDLSNQVVRILGSTPVKIMTEALEQTDRKARLIGQGVLEALRTTTSLAFRSEYPNLVIDICACSTANLGESRALIFDS